MEVLHYINKFINFHNINKFILNNIEKIKNIIGDL